MIRYGCSHWSSRAGERNRRNGAHICGMNAKETKMREFAYRAPRYAVDIPVCFKVLESQIPGRCREIGEGGMKVELNQRVPTGTCGTLSIRCREIAVDLPVRVAHSEPGFDGLEFKFESNADRTAVARLIACFSDSNGNNRPVLVR